MATEQTQAPADTVPPSDEAQDAMDLEQQQLMRKMAVKMMEELEEEERQRRIKDEGHLEEDAVRRKAFNQLIVVQEDLIRCLNLMKVKELEETERVQRITEEKKRDVHEELLRKATAKEVVKEVEEERARQIEESKHEDSEVNVARQKTYDKLVTVQEDLLKTIQRMKADDQMKQEQQRRITEDRKKALHEQLVHKAGEKQADAAMDEEKHRRIEETAHLTDEELQRRVGIAHKMLDVQKELLKTHPPIKPISGTQSAQVLEEAKVHMQEQLLRKAAQREADKAMDEERERRIKEEASRGTTDAQSEVLEQISRSASIKKAKEMADATQQEYILAERKARAQEDTVRKIHQKQADQAMEEERQLRIHDMEGKEPPHIDETLKKEMREHPLSPK